MKTLTSTSLFALGLALAAPTLAQDRTVAGPQADDEQLPSAAAPPDEDVLPAGIIITAQKRSERLQDVPVAVSVISGEQIAASGAVTLENAQYLVPTLNFRKSGTAINQSLFLRGVGTSTFSIAGEPSISTVVDGVVYSRAGEAFSDLIDIDRIEVLRGPQGTLFGKNASAGVINIVTKRPGETFGGFAEGGFYFGEGNEYRARAAVDVPFGPGVAARVTGFYGNYDGNIRNVTTDDRVNGYEHYGVRGMIVAEASPSLSFTLIGDWRQSRDDCCAEVITTRPNNLAADLLPTPVGDRTRAVAQNLVTSTDEESWGVSLQADATVNDTTITSITSYRNYDNTEIRDGDFLPQPYVGLIQLHDFGPQTSKTFSQELRLTSPTGQFLEYVVGGYYSRAETNRLFRRDVINCARTPAPTVLTPCDAPGVAVTRPTGTATFGSVFKNAALFGQATLNLSDRFNLFGGLRFTVDQLDVYHQRVSPLPGPGIAASFGPFRGKATNDNLSGKAGAQFQIVPQSTVYASFARGHKGPAFNVFYNLNANGTNEIAPETSDSYEVGLKNSLFGGTLVVNLAGYYAKYRNFQANNPDIVNGQVVTRFTNAGDISTRGGELDVIWRPLTDLNLSGGFAYTDAHVDQFRVPTSGNTAGVVPNGTTLAYAPKVKASLNADYTIRTGGAVDFQFGTQTAYQSKQLSQFDASQVVRDATTIGGYALVDLSASVLDARGRFKLTGQVKNVFDQSFAASVVTGGPGGSLRSIIPREADRYYGITARVSY